MIPSKRRTGCAGKIDFNNNRFQQQPISDQIFIRLSARYYTGKYRAIVIGVHRCPCDGDTVRRTRHHIIIIRSCWCRARTSSEVWRRHPLLFRVSDYHVIVPRPPPPSIYTAESYSPCKARVRNTILYRTILFDFIKPTSIIH